MSLQQKMNYESIKQLFRISEKMGNSESEIQLKEKELGISLPQAVKTFYLEFGKNKILREAINEFIPLANLTFNELDELHFFYDNQTAALEGYFKKSELSNKRTVIHWKSYADRNWQYQSNDIYNDIKGLCLYSALFRGLSHRAMTHKINKGDLKKVSDQFLLIPKLWKVLDVSFYQNNFNYIIATKISEGYSYIAIAANDLGEYHQIRTILDLKWDFIMKNNEVLMRFGKVLSEDD